MTREIPLTRGMVAIVDDEDYARVIAAGKWCTFVAKRNLYARRHFFQPDGSHKTVRLHNFITGIIGVDHANGDGLDNRRSNLRPATFSQNSANSRLPITNTSGFRGVSWATRRGGSWRATITVDHHQLHLGNFANVEDAARAYDRAALIHFGEFARPNFPREQAS